MAKTFNRPPLQVNTPSSNDTKERFFSHYNWKGVNKNKNFLAVDQETFADSNNVYIADDGTLRSRPAIKRTNDFNFESPFDVETFDETVVIKTQEYVQEVDEYRLKLHFVQNGKVETTLPGVQFEHKLVKGGTKIFIFTKTSISYFDVNTGEKGNAIDSIYIPTTTFDAAGVKTKTEAKNLLTTSEIYIYLYNNLAGVSIEVYGKEVSFEVNGYNYTIMFNDKAPDLIADVKFVRPEGFDVIDVSVNDTYLFYSTSSGRLGYSATGSVFTKSWDIGTDVLVPPKFTQDGYHIVYTTNDDVWIVSVVVDDSTGKLKFETPTRVSSYTAESGWTPHDRNIYHIDFVTWDSFACVAHELSSEVLYVYQDGGRGQIALDTDLVCSLNYVDNFNHDKNCLVITLPSEDDIFKPKSANVYLADDLDFSDSLKRIIVADVGEFVDIKILPNKILFLRDDNNKTILHTLTEPVEDAPIDNKELTSRLVRPILSKYGDKILANQGIYYIDDGVYISAVVRELSEVITPIAVTDYLYYEVDDNIYSTLVDSSIELKYEKTGKTNYILPTAVTALDNYYFGKDETLYISEYREKDGEFLWYFPESNKHLFDNKITNLTPISTTEVAAFFENEIWYVGKSELGYTATKSKLGLGLKSGSDVTTSYDGKQTLFCSNDGFVALSFQDFVASTDQAATFLSDALRKDMEDYDKNPVKLFKKGFWLILYHTIDGKGYVFDFRNGSWWPVSFDKSITKMFIYNDAIYLLAENKFYKLDMSSEDYFDDDGKHHTINWFLTSQKLHLSASNYVKHIVNLTLSSVVDDLSLLTYALDVTNYRKTVNTVNTKLLEYKVQAIRTFVQRLNHFKVNEFQYTLKTDLESAIQAPLNVSDISIKYRISGQVR